MDSQQQYIAQVKEEYDELGIWVPVNEEQEPTESVAAVVPKTEPTDQVRSSMISLFTLNYCIYYSMLIQVISDYHYPQQTKESQENQTKRTNQTSNKKRTACPTSRDVEFPAPQRPQRGPRRNNSAADERP